MANMEISSVGKNMLITGGFGFIGSHLVRRLLKEGHSVIVLKKKKSNTWRLKDVINTIKIYNYETNEKLENIFKENKIDCIIHFAMKYIKTHTTIKDIEEFNEVNITFPATLADFACKYQVSSFVNTGTFTEYQSSKTKTAEDGIIDPSNYYAATKIAFESLLKYFSSRKKIKAVTLKLFSPYGEMDNDKLIVLLIKSFLYRNKLQITKGEQKLSFTYISDTVEAYIKTLRFLSTKYSKYETFNIGTNKTWSIKEVVCELEKIHGSKNDKLKMTLPYPTDEIKYICCNNTKAMKVLGWSPKVDLSKGLKKTYLFYKSRL